MENITYGEALEQRTAVLQNQPHPFYCEARAYCDRHGLESEAQFQQALFYLAHKAFMEESEPLRNAKAKAIALYPATVYLKSDTGALVAVPPELPASMMEQLEQLDELIESIAKRCGLRK